MVETKSDAPGASLGGPIDNGSNDESNGVGTGGTLRIEGAVDISSNNSSGLKRSRYHEDGKVSQKNIRREAGVKSIGNESKPGLPSASSLPPGQLQHLRSEDGIGNCHSNAKEPSHEALEEVPSTPNNQPSSGGREAGRKQQTPRLSAHLAQQAHMGYPHNVMGGIVNGQYIAGVLPAYAPYPHAHGYPGPPPQPIVMGQHHYVSGQSYAVPEGPKPTNSGREDQQTPQQGQTSQQPGYYCESQPTLNDSAQPLMGNSPGASANRPPGVHPHGAFQHVPGMMQMQMPVHMIHYGPPGMFFHQYHIAGMMNPMMSQAFGGNPNIPPANGGRPSSSQQQPYLSSPPPTSAGTPLALSCDDEQLSEYQMLVRKQLEIFEAQPEDVESNTQGRKKQVVLGQVGIRCRHCAGFPLRQRGRGAVYYPAKLQGVYQAAQNMASSHLCESCQCIPPQLKQELLALRERRDTASGGKQYWADGARAMGLHETDEGLRLSPPASDNVQSPP